MSVDSNRSIRASLFVTRIRSPRSPTRIQISVLGILYTPHSQMGKSPLSVQFHASDWRAISSSSSCKLGSWREDSAPLIWFGSAYPRYLKLGHRLSIFPTPTISSLLVLCGIGDDRVSPACDDDSPVPLNPPILRYWETNVARHRNTLVPPK